MKITTKNELYNLFNADFHNDFNPIVYPITLYRVSKKFGWVEKITFTKHPIIYYGLKDSLFIGQDFDDGMRNGPGFSLNDANIEGGGYNDWFVYTTKEEAEAHLIPEYKYPIAIEYKRDIAIVMNKESLPPKEEYKLIVEDITILNNENTTEETKPLKKWVKIPPVGMLRGEGNWREFDGDNIEWEWLVDTGFLPNKLSINKPTE